jgi:diguanylate cyclase (GGDEF)-like protein/putative nucleotidyltransferase with HDIG domain
MRTRLGDIIRWLAHTGAIAGIVVALVGLSAIAVMAARGASDSAADVRTSTNVWNAYQQARYSVVQEALLTQDFRLAGSPDYLEQFDGAADDLTAALAIVENAGGAVDRHTAAKVLQLNAKLADGVPDLVAAVNSGNAARAERIATQRLEPLFRTSISTVEAAAASHRAESRAGLLAAERSENVILGSAVAVLLLGLLLVGTTFAAIRFRNRFDQARRAELERLRTAAFTDSLTGVLNHRAFHEQLAEAISVEDGADPVVLMMIDLDGLKAINDRYGHQVGDEQIKLLAATVLGQVSDPNQLYRLGGDEFAVVLRDRGPAEALQLTDAINEAFPGDVTDVRLGFSAGIALHGTGMPKDELVRRSDVALLEAKRLNQDALVYAPSFDIAIATEPTDLKHLRVLANALARAVDTKDAYTNSHCETVAELSALLAVELGFDEPHVFKVRLAGLLHDVGKIGVPDSILQNPGRLTTAEFESMKAHPVLGSHILSAAERPDEARWILAHHERPDGTGYPHGITDIPLEASIIAVADAFEAMVSKRPYREPRSTEEALAELERCVPSQFDAGCVAALRRVLGRPAARSATRPSAKISERLPLGAAAA